ncbi:MAG TPA: LLM class flavin-dependent oxidoreductase [Dehalococcoidia bacterium]|nr:LLM class flavin-dependent oxidoreductase [Dehalococcoidia bacterium]
MRYGGSFPVTDWADMMVLRDIAQALDEGGMDYCSMATHVLGHPLGTFPNEMLHHYYGPFREPLVLFAWLAGQTHRIVFRTAVLIMPIYPTALLAKQTADISIATGGRLEIGVGISWNEREYRALEQNFHTRGARIEEQLVVLRRLWTEPFVTFKGRWHDLDEIGLNQLPPHIPLLIGAGITEALQRRVARLGDGWVPLTDPVEPLKNLRRYVEEEGKDWSTFKVSGRLMVGDTGPQQWLETTRRLHEAGINDMEIFPGRGWTGLAAAEKLLEVRDVLRGEFG